MKHECEFKKGDEIKFHNRKGTIVSKPEYISDAISGLWYARIKYDDGEECYFCINRTGFKKLE